MRTYELMTIYRPDMAEADVQSEIENVEKALVQRGAEMTSTDFWGKRRLAYEIQHLTEGFYAVQTFQAEPSAVDDVDRALGLADQVIRHKIVRPE